MRLGMGIFAFVALVTIATTGCGAGCQECANEAEKVCACADGITGVQTCRDGTFGECDCIEPPPPAFCGDGLCDAGEARTCPGDCGAPCGDGFCAFTESPATCPRDCRASCGDGFCDAGEDAASCPPDCSSGFCGDRVCGFDESPETCPMDCAASCDFIPTFEGPVSDAMQEAGDPAIAVDTSARIFYVAWIGTDTTTMLPYAFLASVDPDGAIVTRTLAMGTPGTGISIAARDGRVATAWIDVGGQVMLAITTGLTTELLPPTPIASGAIHGTALHADDFGRFAVAWSATDGVHVARFSSDGVRDGADTTLMGLPTTAPAIAGSDPLGVAWLAGSGAMGETELHFGTVDTMGLVDTRTIPETAPLNTSRPAVAWTGLAFLVAWDHSDGVGYGVVDPRLLTLSTPIEVLTTSAGDFGPSLTAATDDLTIAWSGSFVDGEEDVLLARILRSGALRGSVFSLADAAAAQTAPAIAWSGTEVGIVWNDRRDGYGAVWFTAVGLCE